MAGPLGAAAGGLGLERGDFLGVGAGVGAAQALADEEALRAVVDPLLDVELLAQRVAQALGGATVDAEFGGHLVEGQALVRFREQVDERQRPAQLAHARSPPCGTGSDVRHGPPAVTGTVVIKDGLALKER